MIIHDFTQAEPFLKNSLDSLPVVFKKHVLSCNLERGIHVMKKWFYPASLILLLIILTAVILQDGYLYGSNTDWLSQHASLAETIRDACLKQHTLLPGWISLGGGSNGYQFAYYGFLRPDILIGCLLPQFSMTDILIWYMLAVYLCSVLLCFAWLRTENISPALSWIGSVLFMTAGCLFHMHRQIMFVNYLPFLLLAFICIRKKRLKWMPLCMLFICLSSFYFALSAFAAIGWYWLRTEGRDFWRDSFLKRFVPSALLAAGMAAALLLPTGLVLLEHKRGGSGAGLLELLAPNPALNNLLFNEYGMGLTFICLYAILAGLKVNKLRADSILYLLFGLFGIFSYILNAALYARPKILIPFMPLVVLHCIRFLCMQNPRKCQKAHSGIAIWPFAVMLPVGLLWFSQPQFPWILAELGILFCMALLLRQRYRPLSRADSAPQTAGTEPRLQRFRPAAGIAAGCLILAAPTGMYITTAETEDWVVRSEAETGFTEEELAQIRMNPLWHFDSLADPLISGNRLLTDQTRSTMYSSVTNQKYSDLYYDTLMTPIRINNRVALLTSDNPFMLNLLGVRYLETTADAVPAGYHVLYRSGDRVIAENEHVLPSAYFTDDTLSQEQFDALDSWQKLDAITRRTVVDDTGSGTGSNAEAGGKNSSGSTPDHSAGSRMRTWNPVLTAENLPDGLDVRPAGNGWEITAEKTCTLTVNIGNPAPGSIVLCQFHVENLSWQDPVVIDINGIRNKLSGAFAPYPNGNRDFHYQFSTDASGGIDKLEITFSKGHFRLADFQWKLYSQRLLTVKEYTPLTQTDTSAADSGYQVLSGAVTAKTDGYLATSVPQQNGLKILVDGKEAGAVTVNQAFAGTFLTAGEHRIEILFSPPGKTAGCIISLVSAAGYCILLAVSIYRQKNLNGKGWDRL